MAQTSQVKRTVPDKTALMPDMIYKFRGIPTTHTADQLATNLGARTVLSDLLIHRNHSQNLGKC